MEPNVRMFQDDPYGDQICQYLKEQFPVIYSTDNDKLEILSTLLLGTKETRYGPLPSPEGQVKVRQVIKTNLGEGLPIPIMIPWGSIKANFTEDIDIAEVMTIKRLVSLNTAVKRHYQPGLQIIIRIEDTSGYSLFSIDGDATVMKSKIDRYSAKFQTLVRILEPSGSIKAWRESEMPNADKFASTMEVNIPLMEKYLRASHFYMENKDVTSSIHLPEYHDLVKAGWTGYISNEQRNHYFNTYRRLYNDQNMDRLIKRLAIYLACALTRKQLNMNGVLPSWDFGHIQISFVPPTKGLPEGYNNHYLYYRTLPLSAARTHIPAWRAKGYLKINGTSICPKLATFSDTEIIDGLMPVVVTLAHKAIGAVDIHVDYLLES